MKILRIWALTVWLCAFDGNPNCFKTVVGAACCALKRFKM